MAIPGDDRPAPSVTFDDPAQRDLQMTQAETSAALEYCAAARAELGEAKLRLRAARAEEGRLRSEVDALVTSEVARLEMEAAVGAEATGKADVAAARGVLADLRTERMRLAGLLCHAQLQLFGVLAAVAYDLAPDGGLSVSASSSGGDSAAQ